MSAVRLRINNIWSICFTLSGIINESVLEVVLKELPESDNVGEEICYNIWVVEKCVALSTGPR